jgi:glycine cleavage system H lipoate-binding protein
MNMKCPFLEEIIVAYCNACKVKKMVPQGNPALPNKCDAHYEDCAVYQEFMAHNAKEETMTPKIENTRASSELKPCIWMKAGVIEYRMCKQNYDCKNCDFDKSLTEQEGSGSSMVVQAIAKLRQLRGSERKCRYMLTGDFSYKICPNNYECWHCAVDQYIQDTMDANRALQKRRQRAAQRVKTIKGFTIREDFQYLPNHIWVKVEGELLKIGVDDFAARLMGKIEKVDLPTESSLSKDTKCWQIETSRGDVSMSLPVDGEIVERNELLESNPAFVRSEPYKRGWLLKIKLSQDLADRIKGAQITEWLESEFEKLHQECEESTGVTITDGGALIDDFCDRLSNEEWRSLIARFLK